MNYAYLNAKYSKIVTLDDDHAFVSKNALKKFDKYLDRFDYVRGRIILGNGKPTTYFSREVQGTTFGFMKDSYIKFGGYPKFLFADGIGDGNVMNWEFYRLISNKTGINACYAGDIITKDAASARWQSMNLTPESFSSRRIEFTSNFINNYEVNPWMNKGRKKYLWMQLSSFHALLHELYYLPIRLILNLLEFILKFVSKVTKYIFMPQKLIHKVIK